MFGLTNSEMDVYKNISQDFAVQEVTPTIIGNSKFITPLMRKGNKTKPNAMFVQQLVTDVETVITLMVTHIAYDYAHLQSESDMSEENIIRDLHKKYEDYLVGQFIKYGISFTEEIVSEVVGAAVLELPYLYMSVLEDENFDEDSFLEEKMDAYDSYINENFSDDSEEEG